MEIDFAKYYIKNADEFMEGYEKSFELLKDLRKMPEFRELFKYEEYDLSDIAMHSLCLFFTRLMNQLDTGKISRISIYKEILKCKIKRFLRDIKKKEKIPNNPKTHRKKVVVILYSSSQTDTMFPVLKILNKRKNIDLLAISGGFHSQEKLSKEGITFVPFESYFPKGLIKVTLRESKKFKKNWKKLVKNNRFFYNNLNLWKYCKPRFSEDITSTIEQAGIIKNIIDLEKPDILVTATDISQVGKMDVAIAKKMKIPCMVSQHGAAIDCPYYQPTRADKFAVWGNIARDMLINRGYDPKKIAVVGSTKYDGIKIPEKIPKGEFILVSTQMMAPLEQNMFLDALCKALQNINEPISINLHPGQKPDLINKYLNKYNIKADIIPGQPPQGINYFIERCKLMVTICSTTAIDAILVDKPAVTINLSNHEDFIPFAKYGGAIGVWKAEDTEKALKDALYNPKARKALEKGRKKFIQAYLYKNDGKASERFVNIIEKLI